jgi:hypothetical protein
MQAALVANPQSPKCVFFSPYGEISSAGKRPPRATRARPAFVSLVKGNAETVVIARTVTVMMGVSDRTSALYQLATRSGKGTLVRPELAHNEVALDSTRVPHRAGRILYMASTSTSACAEQPT